MPSVRVRENEPFDVAMRRFKRSCEKAGVLAEVHKREFYEKPTQERKRKAAAAVKRWQKKASRQLARRVRNYSPALTTDSLRQRNTHMACGLTERLSADITSALKGGEKTRLITLRFMMAALKQQEIDTRLEVDDTHVIASLTKMTNQRRESIAQFEGAGRVDLAAKERAELAIVEQYLPTPLDEAEIAALIAAALQTVAAVTLKDMGKVMNALRPQLMGRADLSLVSAKVKQLLGG